MIRRLALALAALAAVSVATFGSALPASADDCKPSKVPSVAGTGLPGLIDDRTTAKSPETKYGQYGWAGLRWTTCDLDKAALTGLPKEESTDVLVDTFLGNVGLGAAVALAATMTQLHQWAVDPGEVLSPVDGLLSQITSAVQKSTWTPYVAAVIIAAGLGVALNGFRGEVRRSAKTVAAVGLACLAVAWITTPVAGQSGAEHAAKTFDGVAASIVGGVDSSITKNTAKPGERSAQAADEARGATMQDKLLFGIWARGELGSQTAQAKYGDDLYAAAAVKWSDAATVKPDDKRDDFDKIAQRVKKGDPAAYDTLRGTSLGRSGYGFLAALIIGCIALIRIPAEILMIAGLLVMRILVMFGPVLALTAILESSRPVARAAVKIGLASVVNVTVYGVIAAIHTAATGAIATYAPNLAVATVSIIALTIVVFLIARPFRSVTKLATGQEAADAMTNAGSAPGNAAKQLTGFVSSAAGSYIGNRLGNRENRDDPDRSEPTRIAPSDADPIRENPLPPEKVTIIVQEPARPPAPPAPVLPTQPLRVQLEPPPGPIKVQAELEGGPDDGGPTLPGNPTPTPPAPAPAAARAADPPALPSPASAAPLPVLPAPNVYELPRRETTPSPAGVPELPTSPRPVAPPVPVGAAAPALAVSGPVEQQQPARPAQLSGDGDIFRPTVITGEVVSVEDQITRNTRVMPGTVTVDPGTYLDPEQVELYRPPADLVGAAS